MQSHQMMFFPKSVKTTETGFFFSKTTTLTYNLSTDWLKEYFHAYISSQGSCKMATVVVKHIQKIKIMITLLFSCF